MQRLSSNARENTVGDSIFPKMVAQPVLHALTKPDIIPVRGEIYVIPHSKLDGPLWLPIQSSVGVAPRDF